MILFENKSQCVGCGACFNVCSQNAIRMVADEEGFLYPVIDSEKCVDCGMCKKVCQIYSKNFIGSSAPKVYAAKNKDEEVRKKSTSGGMFSAFADKVISEGGVVYGAAFSEDFTVAHKSASTKEEYCAFRGSKYVQSDLGKCYSSVFQDLKSSKKVLFTGTPCQIAGLSAYLNRRSGIDKSNLILCEIICHGAPSPLMWKEHLKLLESTRKSKIVDYKNRSKVLGWHGHNEHIFFANGKNEYKTKLSQNHKDLFYAHLIIRPSCYECSYTGFPRAADISIADYWGIENHMPDFDDNKGISLLIINTEQGKTFFEQVKNNIEFRDSNLEAAFFDNHKHPAKRNINRENFWREYHERDYLYVLKKYSQYTVPGKIKRQVKFKLKDLSKTIGIYDFIHKITKKKYEKETYK